MSDVYLPFADRTPDSQYRNRIAYILNHGVLVKDTPQGVGALTCFGTLSPMVFDLRNGVPLIIERKIGFWRKPVAELLAFARGVRTIDGLVDAGCNYWEDYRGKGLSLGLDADDLGPGSYGAAFHDFPMPDGNTFNQYAGLIEQIRSFPTLRTHIISPWIPYYTGRGPMRKVIVAPCHGWQQYRVVGNRLHLIMWQRSADFPIGVPSNMIQYAAMLLLICRVTGYEPGIYVHQFGDAHIYEDQVEKMRELIEREPGTLPSLHLDEGVSLFEECQAQHFTLSDYHPHPAMSDIQYNP